MIKLITDSASDIPQNDIKKYGITIMPIPITVDGVTYHESVDFTSEEYYRVLREASSIPTHAQVTMMEFSDAFKKAVAEGYDQIICVTITSKGSGIYDAACMAKKLLLEKPEFAEKVTIDVIDSKGYTYVYGQAVVAAAAAAAEGGSREEVLEVLRQRLEGYAAVVCLTNLDYAKKSGRITAVAAFVGEVLGFRPILALEDGVLNTKTKVRGDHKLIDAMAEEFEKRVCCDDRPYYIICADSDSNAALMKKAIAKKSKCRFGGYYKIGPSVVTNSGPTIFGFIAPVQLDK